MDKNEEITLKVHKNSPHIWAGGLEGKDLAKWLLGKANAILSLELHINNMNEARESLLRLQNSEELIKAYVSLGLSLTGSDPIHPLSMAAIQYDKAVGRELYTLPHSRQLLEVPVPLVGFLELPDLGEALKAYEQKKGALSDLAPTQSGQKAND